MKKLIGAIIGLLVLITILTYAITYHPDDVQTEAVACSPGAPVLKPGQTMKIMTWNVQFMAGKKRHFWYSGGKDLRPSAGEIKTTLQGVADVIKEEQADIVLLQEVDDGAKRTDGEDQLKRLLELLPGAYACHASAFYWKNLFLPHPKILGSVGMKVSTLSKYRIERAVRYSLSPITTDSFISRLFNLKRAVLETRLPRENSKPLVILNTHLSAFAQGSDTMERQIGQLSAILVKLNAEGTPWALGGDFNLLPPGNARDRLDDDNKKKFNSKTEIEPLFRLYRALPGLEDVNGPNFKDWYTFLPNDPRYKEPAYIIDYFFLSKEMQVGPYRALHGKTHQISDHMPIIAEITPDSPAAR